MIIQGNSDQAVKDLARIKSWSPYKYSGDWYGAEMSDKEEPYTIFYRTKRAILKLDSNKLFKVRV